MKPKHTIKRKSGRKSKTMRSKRNHRRIYKKTHTRKHSSTMKKHTNNKRKYTKHRKNRTHKRHRSMHGGNFNETVPFLPSGNAYQPGEINLGKGYYYGLSPDLHAPNDSIMNTSSYGLIGGKRRHNRRVRRHRGGGIIPQQVLDLGRNLMNGAQHVYAGFVGDNVPDSSNPNVMYQPALLKNPEFNIDPMNVPEYMAKNDSAVASGNYTVPSSEYNL